MRRAELFGLPGAGKTTIAKAVRWSHSSTCDVPCTGTLPPPYLRLVDIVKRAERTIPRLSRHVAGIMRTIHRDAWVSGRADEGIWLLDESLSQAGLLLALLGATESQLERYAAQVPIEGLMVLYCETGLREVVRRGGLRRKGGLNLRTGPPALRACVQLYRWLECRGAVMHHLDCHRSAEIVAAEVTGILQAATSGEDRQ